MVQTPGAAGPRRGPRGVRTVRSHQPSPGLLAFTQRERASASAQTRSGRHGARPGDGWTSGSPSRVYLVGPLTPVLFSVVSGTWRQLWSGST